jgi:hypothetical protein
MADAVLAVKSLAIPWIWIWNLELGDRYSYDDKEVNAQCFGTSIGVVDSNSCTCYHWLLHSNPRGRRPASRPTRSSRYASTLLSIHRLQRSSNYLLNIPQGEYFFERNKALVRIYTTGSPTLISQARQSDLVLQAILSEEDLASLSSERQTSTALTTCHTIAPST